MIISLALFFLALILTWDDALDFGKFDRLHHWHLFFLIFIIPFISMLEILLWMNYL